MTDPTENKNWKSRLFTFRSYTPIPFLIVMLLFSSPTIASLVAGFLIALVGESVRFWGVAYAGSETRTTGRVGGTQLVTSGPYSFVRNPLYVGNVLVYLGVGIMSNALTPYLQVIAVLYFALQYSAIVSIEEKYLAENFSGWNDYADKVPRFIPRLSRFVSGQVLVPNTKRALRSERSSLLAFASISCLLCVIYIVRGAS